ncbi:unnamed protein product, partial [Anisakis simplex]|uniref:Lzipper-MIP1 domain-containing protein n=1 Tax=Anisakis simplex TaxID=6269 RepID=A0A0M3JNE9_ANISI
QGRGRKRVEGKKSSDAGKSEETSEGGVVSTSDEMIECGRKLEVKRESAENNVEERRLEKSLKLIQRTDSRAQQGVSTAYSDDDDVSSVTSSSFNNNTSDDQRTTSCR